MPYLVALMSNLLRKNSNIDHDAPGSTVNRMMRKS